MNNFMKMSQVSRLATRGLCSKAAPPPPPAPAPTPRPYVSAATPAVPQEPVGPGALKTGDYKNPEYYCYSNVSFFDFEVEMATERCPQPVADNGHL